MSTPAPASVLVPSPTPAPAADPYLWLEDVLGDRALAWVKTRSQRAEAELSAVADFNATRAAIRAVLDSREQIPHVRRRGEWLYNFWRDATNPRGLWRRTTLTSYDSPKPDWDIVLDLDALAREEKENWVWAGAATLTPQGPQAMLALSRGGADAKVWREFNLHTKRFVADRAFVLPEAKGEVVWIDADSLYVATDTGPGSMTSSGYARTVRRWQRGQALADSALVFEVQADDLAAGMAVDPTPGHRRETFERAIDFYRSHSFLLRDGRPQRLDKPDDAVLTLWREHALLELRSDSLWAGRTWPKGSLLIGPAPDQPSPRGEGSVWQALFTPSATRSLAGWTATRQRLVLHVLDQVASRLLVADRVGTANAPWRLRDLPAPHPGQLSVLPLHEPQLDADPLAEQLLLSYTDFLTPDSLMLAGAGQGSMQGSARDSATAGLSTLSPDSAAPRTLKTRPHFFNASGMRVEQRSARSGDGTQVPYFIVWPREPRQDGRNPTLLYGYGGFEVAMLPQYSGVGGSQWLARGGVYVLANIRGGGEFGPAWHQAAVGANKQRSYDDFIAVAQDLIARGVTTAEHLGIQGGSNGGLLVAAVMLQRPELFGAVVCQVPLLDMRRYHLLLAGASWMAEYGNPDLAQDWAHIARYSPYQNVHAGAKLPPIFLNTSTRDDRVHPGHARKMAARLEELGHRVLYWENTEGGHGGAADNAQRAQLLALEYSFLWRELGHRR
jgi:prolyl oligopeptidase